MTIVNPLNPTNLFLQSASTAQMTAEERQVDLRLEQMVRATVVEGGLDRALLEMNHQRFRAQSEIALKTGQQLTLQVLQTHPTLEFRVIDDPLAGRISQLLPLLTRPYDWAALLNQLREQPVPEKLPAATAQVYQQLQQLLQPESLQPSKFHEALRELPQQLQQFLQSLVETPQNQLATGANQGLKTYLYYQAGGRTEAPLDLPQMLRTLQGRLQQLQATDGRPMEQAWLAETRSLLAALPQNAALTTAPQAQLNQLVNVLMQLRQQPNLPPQFTVQLEPLIAQLNQQTGRELFLSGRASLQSSSPEGVLLNASIRPSANSSPTPAPLSEGGGSAAQLSTGQVDKLAMAAATATQSTPVANVPASLPKELAVELEKLLALIPQQGKATKLAPGLLGRLEGLLDNLRQLPQLAQISQAMLPELELMSGQLAQLVQLGPQRPEGGQLGFLSQLFGFHLEAELLQGKTKQALASLKTSLLALQKELGKQVEEPLRRLELFQLCKARLADEQVQFLPLPFNELEEGYLLMEKQQNEADEESEEALQLSLSLRLSALGNLRVDMLYNSQEQGLQLRIACQDQEKMAYLQEHSDELAETIESVSLQGVNFTADAQLPARQLLERLLPEAVGMFDARI